MKKQTLKKLFAFIISIMFSVSFLQAQTCKNNKVLLFHGGGRLGAGCTSKCVMASKVDKYLSEGWHYEPCGRGGSGSVQNSNKVQSKNTRDKSLVRISADNAMVSKKAARS